MRGVLLVLLALAGLATGGTAISLAMEIAGLLSLVNDAVQLPLWIQLAIFGTGTAAVFAIRSLIRPVERALYGSKEVVAKSFLF